VRPYRLDGAHPDGAAPASFNGDGVDADARADAEVRPNERRLEVDGEEWVAYISGRGAYGTGALGLALVDAVHFAKANAPDVPVLEALVPGGRFADLHITELLTVFRSARRIVIPDGDAPATPRRISLEEDLS
jgi:hypothetical protein